MRVPKSGEPLLARSKRRLSDTDLTLWGWLGRGEEAKRSKELLGATRSREVKRLWKGHILAQTLILAP